MLVSCRVDVLIISFQRFPLRPTNTACTTCWNVSNRVIHHLPQGGCHNNSETKGTRCYSIFPSHKSIGLRSHCKSTVIIDHSFFLLLSFPAVPDGGVDFLWKLSQREGQVFSSRNVDWSNQRARWRVRTDWSTILEHHSFMQVASSYPIILKHQFVCDDDFGWNLFSQVWRARDVGSCIN